MTAHLTPNLRAAAKLVLDIYVPRAKAVYGLSIVLMVSGPVLMLIFPASLTYDRPIAIGVLVCYLSTTWTAGHARNVFCDRMIQVLQLEVSGPTAEQGNSPVFSLLSGFALIA
jgi:hypothetical protein